jgi:hypothetical protein
VIAFANIFRARERVYQFKIRLGFLKRHSPRNISRYDHRISLGDNGIPIFYQLFLGAYPTSAKAGH